MKRDVLFQLFCLPFCYIIVMSKQKRILSFFGWENKREEHRLQTETSRIDDVEEDKLSDTDESEPFAELKAKARRRNFQSTCTRTWLEKFKWLRYKKQRVPKKLECPLENCWLGQNVPPKWNPRSDTGLIDIPVSKCIDHHFNLVWPR